MPLTESDDGRTLTVDANAELSVKLGENPTTGYRWSVDQLTAVVLVSDRFEPGDAIGAAGHHWFVFRAGAPGSGGVKLKLSRPWQGDPPLRAFAVTLIVQ
ncbi:MAG: protease inhibitor I42 family protein [Planctomycetia bacterium]|nr:protease inhibitor I42 family protein [Planctomycetia bacterium]